MARYLCSVFLKMELPLGATSIGSGAECDLQLQSARVARRHALIVVEPDLAVLHALSIWEAVLLNGTPVHGEAHLCDGDLIQIGRERFVFSDATAKRAGLQESTAVSGSSPSHLQ